MRKRLVASALVFIVACGGKVDPGAAGAQPSGQMTGVGDPGASSSTSSSSSSSTSSSSSSSSSSTGGITLPGCSLANPIHLDFESMFPPDDMWGEANPLGIKVDSSNPIAGSKSLAISVTSGGGGPGPSRAYATREGLSSDCGASMSFKLRVDQPLTSGTATIIRLTTSKSSFEVVLDSQGLTLQQDNALLMPLTPVNAKAVLGISITINFMNDVLGFSLAENGQGSSGGGGTIKTEAGSLNALSFGYVDGSAPVGTAYSIDDFDLR